VLFNSERSSEGIDFTTMCVCEGYFYLSFSISHFFFFFSVNKNEFVGSKKLENVIQGSQDLFLLIIIYLLF